MKFLKISLSGVNLIKVPFLSSVLTISKSSFIVPFEKTAFLTSPSLNDVTEKESDNALTAFVPTPFKPTDFLNASESYLPPVFILETQSKTFPKGIPLP